MTFGADHRPLILPEKHPDVLLVPLLLQSAQEREDPGVPPHSAVEQLAPNRRLEPLPRRVRVRAELAGRLEQQAAAGVVTGLGPGIDRTVGQAAGRIRHDQRLVVLQHGPEAVAAAARTPRVVEGEEGRRNRQGRGVARAAGEQLGEAEPFRVA
jgi:hypothetical protein